MGQSTLPLSRDFSFSRAAAAVVAVLDFLKVDRVSIFSFDKGSAVAVSLAHRHSLRVAHLIVSEYALPGFGHKMIQAPSPDKTIFHH
jgi:pimeloyl-ACP methyl ester carboxylesterase